MKLKINLHSSSEIKMPVGFSAYLQAMIYNHLHEKEAEWLHKHGFEYEKRRFKLFAFSDIQERSNWDKQNKILTFPSDISFFISSPVHWILEQLAQNLLTAERVQVGKENLAVSSIEILKGMSINESPVRIRALSPIEVHSTFTLENGKKKTYYYTPYEEDFSELVNQNLKKKWHSFYNEECHHDISIRPLFHGNKNEKVYYFGTGEGRTVIKGWKGHFKIEGAVPLIEFACDTGLGSRNSQGFGCVEAVG